MHSKGISWIDDCRIPFVDDKDSDDACKSDLDRGQSKGLWLFTEKQHKRTGGNTKGRFPANILVSDDMLNDGNITSQNTGYRRGGGFNEGIGGWKITNIKTQGDKGTNSRYYDIDKWFDKIINYE